MTLLDRAALLDGIARRSLADERARHAQAVAALDPRDSPAVVGEAERHRDNVDDIIAGFGARLASRHPTPPPPTPAELSPASPFKRIPPPPALS